MTKVPFKPLRLWHLYAVVISWDAFLSRLRKSWARRRWNLVWFGTPFHSRTVELPIWTSMVQRHPFWILLTQIFFMLIEQSPTFLRNRLNLICMTDLFCACPISGAVAWDGRQHRDDRQWQGCVSDPMWSKGSIFLCRATFESNRAQNLGLQATQTLVAIALTDKSQWRATFDYSKRLKKKYDPPVHMPRKRSKGSIDGFALLLLSFRARPTGFLS